MRDLTQDAQPQSEADLLSEHRLNQFAELSDDELAELDIAAVNLVCAVGLPGAHDLDVDRYLNWLDDATHKIKLATERNYYKFLENPAAFHNSQAYFCIVCMIELLQTQFGVRYNPKWQGITPDQPVPREFGQDARDVFVHPIIDGIGGTCGSLPILYIAVGRRLGYPLKVVKASQHLFARWDDPDGNHWHKPERFNIEASGRGVHLLPDEHYKTWPRELSDEDIEAGIFLKSLSPREELAEFLATRGFVWLAHNRLKLALDCFERATELSPRNGHFARWRLYAASKRELLICGNGFLNAPDPMDVDYPEGPFWVRTPQGQELLVQFCDPWACRPTRPLSQMVDLEVTLVSSYVRMPSAGTVRVEVPKQDAQYRYNAYWLRLSTGKTALVCQRERRHMPLMPFSSEIGQPAIPSDDVEDHHIMATMPRSPGDADAIMAAFQTRQHLNIGLDFLGKTLPGLLAGPAIPRLGIGTATK